MEPYDHTSMYGAMTSGVITINRSVWSTGSNQGFEEEFGTIVE